MIKVDNISFQAKMNCSIPKNSSNYARWANIQKAFEAQTSEHKKITMEILETEGSAKTRSLVTSVRTPKTDGFTAYISPIIYRVLMGLKDNEIVNKLKEIMKISIADEELAQVCEEFINKVNLKGKGLNKFYDAIEHKQFDEMRLKFKDDAILSRVEFNK